jgi:hypothetical protein
VVDSVTVHSRQWIVGSSMSCRKRHQTLKKKKKKKT